MQQSNTSMVEYFPCFGAYYTTSKSAQLGNW